MSSLENLSALPDDDEVVWGAKAIAAELNCSLQRFYYLHSLGKLPVDNVSHRLLKSTYGRLRKFKAGETSSPE